MCACAYVYVHVCVGGGVSLFKDYVYWQGSVVYYNLYAHTKCIKFISGKMPVKLYFSLLLDALL